MRLAKRTLIVITLGITSLAHAQTKPSATVVVPATVEAFEQTDLYAKAAGYLTDVKVDIGDHVTAGQVLAVIDVPELQTELLEAKAMLNAKKQLLAAAEAGIKQVAMSLEVAKHQVAKYKADAQFQEITLKRQQELFSGKAITDQQLDEVRNKSIAAAADVGVAEAKVAAADADVVGSRANRDVAAAQVDVAAAQIEKIATLLRYASITSPYDGVVTRRLVNRGDLVQAATATRTGPLFTVLAVHKVRIFCEVPQEQVGIVAKDTAAAIKISGIGGEAIAGRVTRMSGALDPTTRTLRVEIDLLNPGEKILPGMYAQVTLTPEAKAEAK